MELGVHYLQDLWKNYGFLANPFDTNPLTLTHHSLLPIGEAIVGRGFATQESRMIYNILRNTGGARVVVEGNVGVGKTTFVNYHRYLWEHHSEDRLFTPQDEIAVTAEWRLSHFLLNILSALIDKVVDLHGEKKIAKIGIFKEIRALSKVLYENNFSIEGSVMGFGAGFSRSGQVNIPVLPDIQLLRYFREMVKEIKNLGYAGIFLHLDNLEILGRQDIQRVRSFFEDIRDSLQIPDVYFVFVGNQGFFRDVISPLARVRSIFFGRPITIPPLSKEQVITAIHKRYQLLALRKGQFIQPIEDALLEYLYDLYAGNLRYIMDAMNMLIPELNQDHPRTIASEHAKKCLAGLVTEQIRAVLTQQEWEVFGYCIRQRNFTNKDLSQQFGINAPNMVRVLNRLRELDLVQFEHKDGKRLFYKASEYAQMAQYQEYPPPPRLIDPQTGESKPYKHLSKQDKRVAHALTIIREHGRMKHCEYAEIMQVSVSTATRDLNMLVEQGKLRRHGHSKNTSYEIVE